MIRAAFLVWILAAFSLRGQVVETPVAFDSAAKVPSLTPALVVRFGLRAPTWPVQGAFVEARLYASSAGGSVLVAERNGGRLERYQLGDDQVAALRAEVDAAMSRGGSVVTEAPTASASNNARSRFVRNQMILSAILYGPLLASMTDDAKTGTAMYLISIGASYFALNGIPKTTLITRAQADLATDGALRGYAGTSGMLIALNGTELNRKTYSGIGLLGALGGSAIGYKYGRGLTDSEAQAAMKFSTFSAGAAFGALGAAGLVSDDNSDWRSVAGAATAAGAVGYIMGPLYPRRAKYTVTAGDVKTLTVGAILGAAVGATPFVSQDDAKLGFAAGTIGGVAGLVVADRGWVRPFDYGTSDAAQLWLGTIAGALLGGGAIVLTEPSDPVVGMAMVTTGGVLGAFAGHRIADPPRAGQRGASNADDPRFFGGRLRWDASSLALVAARVPGQHALVSLRF